MTTKSEASKDTDIGPQSQAVGCDDPFLPDLVGRKEVDFQKELFEGSDEMQATIDLGQNGGPVKVFAIEAKTDKDHQKKVDKAVVKKDQPVADSKTAVEPAKEPEIGSVADDVIKTVIGSHTDNISDTANMDDQDDKRRKRIADTVNDKLKRIVKKHTLAEVVLSQITFNKGDPFFDLLMDFSLTDLEKIAAEIDPQEIKLIGCGTDQQCHDAMVYVKDRITPEQLCLAIGEKDAEQYSLIENMDRKYQRKTRINFWKKVPGGDLTLILERMSRLADSQESTRRKRPPSPIPNINMDALEPIPSKTTDVKKEKSDSDTPDAPDKPRPEWKLQRYEFEALTTSLKKLQAAAGTRLKEVKAKTEIAIRLSKLEKTVGDSCITREDVIGIMGNKIQEGAKKEVACLERKIGALAREKPLSGVSEERINELIVEGRPDAVDVTNLVTSEQFEKLTGELLAEKLESSQRLDALKELDNQIGAIKSSVTREAAARKKDISDMPRRPNMKMAMAILAFCVVNLAVALGGIFLPRQTTQIEQPASIEAPATTAPVQPVAEEVKDFELTF